MAKDGNAQRFENLLPVIRTAEPKFREIAKAHGATVDFARESEFAIQIMRKNDYLARVAYGNQDSLKDAVVNVAAVGLSLCPALKLAYLVPRAGAVCLDVSYQGYVKLGTDCGGILWAGAEIVCENDEFRFTGMNREPIHVFNPMHLPDSEERGKIVGGYCSAKTPGGEFIISFMPIDEIIKMRDRSEGWKAYVAKKTDFSPWISDEFEMIKKTLIRRGSKSWPKGAGAQRLAAAVELTSDIEPTPALPDPAPNEYREKGFKIIREMLTVLDREEVAYVAHLARVTNRKVEKLEDLTNLEVDQAVTMLQGFVDAQEARIAKLKQKEKNENAS